MKSNPLAKISKKTFAVLLVLVYFLFFSVPGPYSLRFSFAILFPFVFLTLIVGRKSKILMATICTLVLVILLFTSIIPQSYTVLVGDSEIGNTVNELVRGLSSPEQKVKEIMRWEGLNITNMYTKSNLVLGLPIIWERDTDNPSWIFFYKRGSCGEYATLFVKMAELAGINSRKVFNPAEDHSWAEVYLNGSWVQVDPSNNEFINPADYEKERGFGMSYVYTIENGEVVELTSQYTGTAVLTVRVVKDNEPVQGVEITVKSRCLMEKYPSLYQKALPVVPRETKIFSTNENGVCIFNLGGNDYTIVAENYGVEKNTTLQENTNDLLTMFVGAGDALS